MTWEWPLCVKYVHNGQINKYMQVLVLSLYFKLEPSYFISATYIVKLSIV